jgi:hypothetical protein
MTSRVYLHTFRKVFPLLSGAGMLLLVTNSALAQLSTVSAPAGFGQSTGVKMGSFNVSSRAEAGISPTSNIRLDSSEESDIKRILALSGSANSDWQRHNLAASIDFFAQDAADSAHDAQDNEALSASLLSRFELGGNAILRGGLQRQQSIIGKNHVDQLNGFLHGTSTNTMVSYGAEWDNSQWFLSAMGQMANVKNDTDVQGIDDVMEQSLDRNESQVTLQSGRHYPWGNVYGFVGAQAIDYDASLSLQMGSRDSDGWRVGGGAQFSHGRLRGAVSAITFTQNFDTNSILNLHATVGTVQLGYQLSERFTLSGLLQRNFSESNIDGSAGIFTSTYFAGVMYSPAPQIYFKLGPAYNRSQLADSSSATKRVSWEWASVWQVHPRAAVSFAASHSSQGVNDPGMAGQKYDETSGTLSLVLTY